MFQGFCKCQTSAQTDRSSKELQTSTTTVPGKKVKSRRKEREEGKKPRQQNQTREENKGRREDIHKKLSLLLSQQSQTEPRPHQRMTWIQDNQDDSHRQIHTQSVFCSTHRLLNTFSVSHAESAPPISHISPPSACLVSGVCERHCLYRSSLPEREWC